MSFKEKYHIIITSESWIGNNFNSKYIQLCIKNHKKSYNSQYNGNNNSIYKLFIYVNRSYILEHNGRIYSFLFIYRSSNGYINNFLIEFNYVNTNLVNTHKNTKIMIIDDLNINILDDSHNAENYLDILNTLHFSSGVNNVKRPKLSTCRYRPCFYKFLY